MNKTPLGSVIDRRTLRMERVLPAPIDKVWAYLVEPDKRARWLAGGTPAGAAGSTMDLRFDHGALTDEAPPERYRQYLGVHVQQSRVLRIEPPRLLVMTWQEGSDDASEVRFELTERGGETLLTLVHSKLPRREQMIDVAGGWHAHLDVLEDVLGERRPRPFWSTLGEAEAAYSRLVPA